MIGLINYQYSNQNYGAVLQAAALHYFIENRLGFECEHINYIPKSIAKKRNAVPKGIIIKFLMLLGFRETKQVHSLVMNSKTFEDFRNRWLPRTGKVYKTLDELRSEEFDYSHVVVGSDQVWRPSYAGADSLVYFLGFLNQGVKRISYAASFGTNQWSLDSDETEIISNELNKFSSISVRENSAIELCQKVFNVDAEHVLDPTLLVGKCFFNEITKGASENVFDGIVFYKLDTDADFEQLIKDVEEKLCCASKNIYMNKKFGISSYYNVDAWLSFIKNSRFVITDSFHCVCFSILFEKPFFYYPNSARGLTRIESLLEQLGLFNLIFEPEVDTEEMLSRANKIDFKKVNDTLKHLRNNSISYLQTALEN